MTTTITDWRSTELDAALDAAGPGGDVETAIHAYTDALGLPEVAWVREDDAYTGWVASTVPTAQALATVWKYARVLGDGIARVDTIKGLCAAVVWYADITLAGRDAQVRVSLRGGGSGE